MARLLKTGAVDLVHAHNGRTALIAPFFYSFAPWAVASGLVVWGTLPTPLALAGIALISVSGVANALLEQRRGAAQSG